MRKKYDKKVKQQEKELMDAIDAFQRARIFSFSSCGYFTMTQADHLRKERSVPESDTVQFTRANSGETERPASRSAGTTPMRSTSMSLAARTAFLRPSCSLDASEARPRSYINWAWARWGLFQQEGCWAGIGTASKRKAHANTAFFFILKSFF